MKRFAAVLLCLLAISSVFDWHLDGSGKPKDIDEVAKPFVSMMMTVTDAGKKVAHAFVAKESELVPDDSSVADLYRPFVEFKSDMNPNYFDGDNFVDLYLSSVSIKTDGSYHACYVVGVSSSGKGRNTYMIVQDLDKSDDSNLEGWFFRRGMFWLCDEEWNFPWRSFKSFELTNKTLDDLDGPYWTPEGMVNVE